MKTVLETFGLRKTKGAIGIEVEVEGDDLLREGYSSEFDAQWRCEQDGSLRGESMEYVLRAPLPLGKIKSAMDRLQNSLDNCGASRNESVRTGVHVHINVQNISMTQVFTFITCYLILERVLLNFCSPSRRGNLFCLSSNDAEYLIWAICQAVTSQSYRSITNDNVRYAAVNLKALSTYGSVEFRALETPDDLDKVTLWAKALYNIKENSLRFDNPQEVVHSMSENGGKAFIERMLGTHASHFMTQDASVIVYEGVRHAQDVAFAVDWDEFRAIEEESKKKRLLRKGPGGPTEVVMTFEEAVTVTTDGPPWQFVPSYDAATTNTTPEVASPIPPPTIPTISAEEIRSQRDEMQRGVRRMAQHMEQVTPQGYTREQLRAIQEGGVPIPRTRRPRPQPLEYNPDYGYDEGEME